MRKLLITAAIAAIASASPAFATNSAETHVNAFLAQSCTIKAVEGSITLTTVGDAGPNRTFTYSCNFVGQPSINIVSSNAGLTSGSNTADYGVWVNDADIGGTYASPSSWAQASTLGGAGKTFGPSDGFLMSSTPNHDNNPFFHVGLTTPITVAGSYSDTLTFTINP